VKRDPAPAPAITLAAVAEMTIAARRAIIPGARPAGARQAILTALRPLWPDVPPEAAREMLVTMAERARACGVRTLPAGVADQTAGWLLELAGQQGPGPAGMPAVAGLASSVAFDRDEDTQTLTSLATLAAVAFLAEDRAPGRAEP
jgi:hypothetical protein